MFFPQTQHLLFPEGGRLCSGKFPSTGVRNTPVQAADVRVTDKLGLSADVPPVCWATWGCPRTVRPASLFLENTPTKATTTGQAAGALFSFSPSALPRVARGACQCDRLAIQTSVRYPAQNENLHLARRSHTVALGRSSRTTATLTAKRPRRLTGSRRSLAHRLQGKRGS